MTQSEPKNKTQSKDSAIHIKDIIAESYRFRFFIFILLIYVAGATLDITNTNPGSRFMLTKEIAQEGDFAIREAVRERYSYLDFSVINQIENPSFEVGEELNPFGWATNGTSSGRTVDQGYNGNYSMKLTSQMNWVEQDLEEIDVNKIYQNYTFKIWVKRESGLNTYLNITFTFTDNTKANYWILIGTTSFLQYSIQFETADLEKSISNIRFENANTTDIYLDDCELFYSYSDKPIGVSLLAVPIYWVGEFILVEILGLDDTSWTIIDDFAKLLIMISVLIFAAFTVLRFYDFLRLEGISHSKANWTALLFGLGSLYYVYAGTFFSHSITASLLLLALYYGSKFRKERTITSLLWAGIFSGYSVVCDYIFLFFLPFFFVYLFIPFPWSFRDVKTHWKSYFRFYLASTIVYMIPVLICGLLVTYYNFISFGNPFVTPYSFARFFKDVQHFAAPMEEGLEILLTSSHHGLITFMPIILVSTIGIIPLYRKNPALAILCITTPMLLILLYSKYYLPTGGLAYGPRQLVPITPFLLIPLAFIIDIKDSRKDIKSDDVLLHSIYNALKFVIVQITKVFAILFGFITFIINFAGGWVGVYPIGGQDMADPIWGTVESVGHLETLFSWIDIAFDFNGKLSLEILQGHYAGGLRLNLIIAGISLDIQWPAASTLALFEIGAFSAILFLILLINPYYSIGNVKNYITGKLKPINNSKNPKKVLKRYTLIESSLLIIFIIWIVLYIFRITGIPFQNLITDILIVLKQIQLDSGLNPLLDVLLSGIYFIIYTITNFFFIRSDLLSLQTWFFNSLLFILVTSIAWLPYSQIKKSNKPKRNEESTTEKSWSESKEFQQFHIVGRILAGVYFIQSLLTIFLANPGNTIYSEFSVTMYIAVLALIIGMTIPPAIFNISAFFADEAQMDNSNIRKSNSKINETNVSYIVFLFILLMFILKIIMQFMKDNIPLSDFLIIRPSLDNFSIAEWFFQGKNAVPIYLTIFVVFLLVGGVALILPELNRRKSIRSVVPLLPLEVEERIQNEGNSLAGVQSLLLFLGYVVFFQFLLITVLYSALSSVPNPSLLPTYPEENVLWVLVFIIFVGSIFFSGINYLWKDHFKGNKRQSENLDTG